MRFSLAKTVAWIPVVGLSAALCAHAANDGSTGNPSVNSGASTAQQSNQQRINAQHVRASKLIGMEVRNAQDENLGEINDLVVDVNNQRVHYAILAFGGFMGMGEKLFAYPVRVFSMGREGDALVLNVEKERLKAAPGFERDRWPDWQAEDGYRTEVDRYYGPTVQVEPKPDMQLRRASQLLDADVAANGEDVGDVDDMVVNLSNGQVQFVVVELEEGWAQPDRLTLLPLRAFQHTLQNTEDLTLRLSRNQVATAPGFAKDRWPDLDREYRTELDAWFDNLDVNEATAAGGGAER
jgi:sporulation protein YlmC with PRC-barrel domain